jgi:aryl-alcohol dehydrogenase-like predicted oxidoreductase
MATTLRPLGKTGVEVTLLGMGTGVKAWGGKSELLRKGDEPFMTVVKHAYEKGIRYFDLADAYGSHRLIKGALKSFMDRDKVTLLTKSDSRDADGLRADLERSRQELDTDRLDVVLLHCVNDRDWPERLKGCMDVLSDAKAKGVIRAHGISCHSLESSSRAAETEWGDVLMERINPFGRKMDAAPEEVVPVLRKAHANGKAVLGIKIAGEGECSDQIGESLKYVLGLGCISAMPIGFLNPAEIDSALAHIDGLGLPA